MQSSRPFQTEEDNLEGERGGTVPGMFIESSARQRRGNEGVRGQRVERKDKETRGEGQRQRASRGEKIDGKLYGQRIDG